MQIGSIVRPACNCVLLLLGIIGPVMPPAWAQQGWFVQASGGASWLSIQNEETSLKYARPSFSVGVGCDFSLRPALWFEPSLSYGYLSSASPGEGDSFVFHTVHALVVEPYFSYGRPRRVTIGLAPGGYIPLRIDQTLPLPDGREIRFQWAGARPFVASLAFRFRYWITERLTMQFAIRQDVTSTGAPAPVPPGPASRDVRYRGHGMALRLQWYLSR